MLELPKFKLSAQLCWGAAGETASKLDVPVEA